MNPWGAYNRPKCQPTGNEAGALSVLDWQVTFPPNLATVKSANLPFDETSASLGEETA